jgi:hypothetical protein
MDARVKPAHDEGKSLAEICSPLRPLLLHLQLRQEPWNGTSARILINSETRVYCYQAAVQAECARAPAVRPAVWAGRRAAAAEPIAARL